MSFVPRKHVVVPYDFSDESREAVQMAMDLVESAANITVVHVLPELTVTEPGVIWDSIDDESRIRHAERAMRENLTGFGDLKIEVRIGDPGREITEFASESGVDLIVIPSHGRTGLKRLLLGSVAERVVRLAHCPVLVLRK